MIGLKKMNDVNRYLSHWLILDNKFENSIYRFSCLLFSCSIVVALLDDLRFLVYSQKMLNGRRLLWQQALHCGHTSLLQRAESGHASHAMTIVPCFWQLRWVRGFSLLNKWANVFFRKPLNPFTGGRAKVLKVGGRFFQVLKAVNQHGTQRRSWTAGAREWHWHVSTKQQKHLAGS